MDAKKQILVNSIISFLRNELSDGSLDEDRKESLEVAIQCVETAFEVQNPGILEKVDLFSLINVKSEADITDEQKAQAEELKIKGNNFMKTSEYQQAIGEYTKAIEVNPYNAVYYCNRAAAYTRLMKDLDAINDCNEAIKLDPTYGKAYGRLGIAYSNLNKNDLALKAYQTALKYDPTNSMYATNLKVAQERLRTNLDGALPTDTQRQIPDNLAEFVDNPNLVNMAAHILSDRNFHSMMLGMINNITGNPDEAQVPEAVETMLQAGQALAQRVTNEPGFYNRVVRNARARQGVPPRRNSNPSAPNPESNENDSDKKGS